MLIQIYSIKFNYFILYISMIYNYTYKYLKRNYTGFATHHAT